MLGGEQDNTEQADGLIFDYETMELIRTVRSEVPFTCRGNQSHFSPDGTILSVAVSQYRKKLIRITSSGERAEVTGDIE